MANNNIKQFSAQARLGRIHDNIRREIIGLNTQLISLPVECLTLREKKSRTNDIITHTAVKAGICHIAFPKIENVPLRTIRRKDGSSDYKIDSLVDIYSDESQKQFFTVVSKERLTVDDLIIRVLFPEKEGPVNVLILQVNEPIGTLGSSSLIKIEYKCSLFVKELPEDLMNLIIDWAKRRGKIDY